MPEEQDHRIRHLFEEADGASPEPPPMPRIDAPPFQWRRFVLVPAAAVFTLFVGAAVVAQFLDLELGFAATADGADIDQPTVGDQLVTALADLNVACDDLAEYLVRETTVDDDEVAATRLEGLAVALEPLAEAIDGGSDRFPDDSGIDDVVVSFDDLSDDVALALTAGTPGAAGRYLAIRSAIGDLGDQLAQIGALGCADLNS